MKRGFAALLPDSDDGGDGRRSALDPTLDDELDVDVDDDDLDVISDDELSPVKPPTAGKGDDEDGEHEIGKEVISDEGDISGEEDEEEEIDLGAELAAAIEEAVETEDGGDEGERHDEGEEGLSTCKPKISPADASAAADAVVEKCDEGDDEAVDDMPSLLRPRRLSFDARALAHPSGADADDFQARLKLDFSETPGKGKPPDPLEREPQVDVAIVQGKEDEQKGAALKISPEKAAGARDTGVEEPGKELAPETDVEDDGEEEEEEEEQTGGKFDPGKMQRILSSMTDEQMNRYECYRRSTFNRAAVKRLVATLANSNISIPTAIVVSGLAKMLVGDLVELSREVMRERDDSGPIRPTHLREAHRRLRMRGKLPSGSGPARRRVL